MDEALKWLVGVVQQGGSTAIAAVALTMWWLERQERKETQDRFFTLAEKVAGALIDNTRTLDDFKDLIGGRRRADR